jgi:lipid II:glycine glycyltransferase (peptidoglycan interpeptide bridge formation enzyme)
LEEATDMRAISSLDAEPLDDAEWDSFVAASPEGHLLQTSRWGALKARFGWAVERVALTDGHAIVAGAQVLYRSLPLGLLTLAYVPMGPLVDWGDEEAGRTLLAALRRAARRRRAFCLKLESHRPDDPALAARLIHYGLRPSPQTIQPRSTILIDLDGEEDEIVARFNKRTRQKVRKATRAGVVVQDGIASDISAFQGLMKETAQRKGFAIHSAELYHAA